MTRKRAFVNMEAGQDMMANATASSGMNKTEVAEGFANWILVQVHIVAMVNLSTSIIISVLVISYILKKHRNIFKRPIGERLVFYLAFGDLCFSISHLADHAIVLYMDNSPPEMVCRVIGFFMTSYFNSPCVVVVVTAVNAFVMVVLQKKIHLGVYDWKLLVGAFVAPQAASFIFACFGWLGWTGVWCGFNYGTPQGLFLGQANAILNIAIFIINLVCYMFIWCKIRAVANKMKAGDQSGKAAESAAKYHKSARVMMIFVVSFVLQYWAITIYYSWEFFGSPHISIVFLTVTFTNQGGLFNFFAYTYVRKKYSSTGSGGGGGDASTTGAGTSVTTVDNASKVG